VTVVEIAKPRACSFGDCRASVRRRNMNPASSAPSRAVVGTRAPASRNAVTIAAPTPFVPPVHL